MGSEVSGSACFSIECVIKDKDGNIKHHSLIDEDGKEKVFI